VFKGQKRIAESKSTSYVEFRMLAWMAVGAIALAFALPTLLRAVDWNGDNLPDDWESQYGISTNAYDSTNLVGWWQMETNTNNLVLDRTTNQINGSLTNFATNPYVAGVFSNALAFTPTAQVSFGTNSALNSAAGPFTFSTWFLSTNIPTAPATIATWKDVSSNSWSLQMATNGAPYVSFANGGGGSQNIGPGTSAVQLYDGTWHQVAVTYDTNQVATVYVDGDDQASGAVTNWSPGSVASFTLGVPSTNSVNPAYDMDETRLYNRSLGSNEVSQLPVTYSDLNSSGLTVLEDYEEGLNPLSTNGIITSAFVNSGLTAYYNNQLPALVKASGDSQIVAASTFAANPLVVQVKDGSGNPLTNAPITFTISSGSDGVLSQTSGGATTTSLSITTDGSGNATVYYQAGPDVLQNNTITATAVSGAGSVSVNFTAYCGVQSGLVSWLDGDSGVMADGSGNVSGWQDQTANGNSASQTTSGIQPTLASASLQNHNVIHFDGSSTYLAMPACIADDFTMVVVFRSSLGTGSGGEWFSAGGIVDGETPGVVNDFGMSLDPAGEVLTGVGNPDTSVVSNTGGFNDGRGHIATFLRTESSGSFSQYIDSVYQSSQTGNTGTLNSPPRLTIGATQTLANYFGGDVAEVLLYNRNLSSTEQQEIEGFLADKYGLYSEYATWPSAYSSDVQAQVAANHWTKAEADAYVAFVAEPAPVPASGLLLWLDASQGVSTDSSNNVLQWTDQSPSGHILAQTSQAGPPVLQNDSSGHPIIRFNGGQALYAPDYLPANGDVTIISVESIDNPTSNFETSFALGSPTYNTTRALNDDWGSLNLDLYYNNAQGGPAPAAGQAAISTITYSRGSGAANFYLNGAYDGYGNASAADLTSGIVVGNAVDFSAPLTGSVSEVLVYNRILSDGERNQAEGYMADQHGVYDPAATWPLAYGIDVEELIIENNWSKAQADAYVASLGGAVAAPTLSPAPGSYSSSQTVTVTSATTSATIYYTTDGSTPTTSSSSIANGGTIAVFSNTQLQAMAADGTDPNSPVTAGAYFIGNSGSLVAGDSFTMVNKPDGTVWTWGDDSRGQQGDNQANNPAATPQQVPSLSGITSVAAGGDHALAVKSDGTVWAWGADDQSQCGDGGTSDLLVATQLSGLANIVSVAAGQVNGFAIDNGGNLYAWGNNDNGQLGDGTTNSQSTPEAITSVTGVVKVVSSPNFTLALKSDGTVWATGSNGNGALGDGTYNNENYFQPVPGLSGVKDIAVGWGHALALLSNGTVWSWGYGWDGELGHGTFNPGTNFPQQVVGLPPAVAVEAVDSKSFVLLADGTLRCFGGNAQGNLGAGFGNVQNQASPIQPPGISNVMLLAAGTFHTVICTGTGAFYGWGDNTNYRLTQDFASDNYNIPSEVHDPSWQGFTSVAGSGNSSIALKGDGTVWCVGEGDYGLLGQGDYYSSESPVQTVGLSSITKIAGANGEAFAIRNDGTLFGWGGNWNGQLGLGTYNTSINTPTQVTNVANVTGVAEGDNHMLAVESNGTVWAAGDDAHGELGDSTTNEEDAPIQVAGLSNATQVAAGTNTSFVLKSDGTVWAWGENDTGWLGLGTTGDVQTPTQITTLPAMVAIAAQGINAMGIDESGNVWTWGLNGNSDGTPLEQTGLTNVTAIAAGVYHNLAIKNDGTLWALGAGWLGQLGNNSYDNDNNFTQISGVQGATAIGASFGSSWVVKQDGTIAGFGSCNNGELAGGLGIYAVVPKPLFGIAMSETPPTVSITAPSTGATGTEGTAIDLQASATASAGSITKVDYFLNGIQIGTSSAGGTWDASWTPTTNGNLTLEAVAYDSAGVAQVSAPITLSIGPDISPTPPTSVTATTGAAGTVYLGWTNGSGATSILIQEKIGGGSWTTIATLTDPSIVSYAITDLSSGQDYSFRVVEQNANGNTSASVSFPSGTSNPPALTKVSGDSQDVAASTFEANPLVVQVSDSAGHSLSNALVSFSLATGSDGGLATSSGGTTASSQSISTNAAGQATIYYESGSDVLQNNTIVATVGASSANFIAYCGVQNQLTVWLRADAGVTADGSGKVSSWVDQGPSHYSANGSVGTAPLLVSGAYNGNPAIRFDGASQYLQIPSLTDGYSGGVSVFAVFNPTSNSSWSRIFDFGNGNPANNLILARESTSSQLVFQSYQGAAATENFASSNDLQTSQLQQYTVVDNPTASANMYKFSAITATATGEPADSVTRHSNFIGRSNWGDPLFQGDIAEILIYSRPLSDSERGQVEGYLADKYGLYNPNATWPLSYSSDVQAQITANEWTKAQADAYAAFLATNPPVPPDGLALWLKADTGVTADSYGNVTQWQDQSPSGNTVEQTTSGVQPTLGTDSVDQKPTIQFNGSQRLVAPSSTRVPLDQDWTIITYGISQDVSSERYMLSVGDGGVAGGLRGVGNSGSQNLVAFWNYATNVGPYLNQGELGVVETVYTQSSGQLNVYDRGTLAGTVTESLSPTNSGLIVGDVTSGFYPRPWDGDIQEILVYNRALSDSERHGIEGYLADKYQTYSPYATWPLAYSSAVQAEINLHQWNQAQANSYVAMQNNNRTVPTNGLTAWYRADTGVTYDSSNNVTGWADQSGNYPATQTTSGAEPLYVSNDLGGKPALRFNGSQWLSNSANLNLNADMTIIAVGESANPSNKQFSACLGTPSATGACRGMGYNGSVQAGDFYYVGTGGASVPAANTFVEEALSLDPTRSNVTFYRNGSETGTATVSGLANLTPGISVGSYGGGNDPWQGDIAEVMVYDHQLTSAEIAQVDGYLADKYGYYTANASWPLSYSSDVQAQIVANGWSRSQADAYVAFLATSPPIPPNGLALWLKTDTGLEQSGGNVTGWADQSPNGNNASPGSIPPTVIANSLGVQSAVHFDGTGNTYLTIPDAPTLRPNTYTILAVAKEDNGDSSQYLLSRPYRSTGDFGGWTEPTMSYGVKMDQDSASFLSSYVTTVGSSQVGALGTNTYPVGRPVLLTWRYDGSNLQNFSQGSTTPATSAAATGDIDYSGGTANVAIGIHSSTDLRGADSEPLNADLYEILVYNRALTNTEVQQVGTYLADKYGLYDPNATWPLAYSSDVQAEITLNQWSKDQADNYVSLQTSNPDMLTTGLIMWLKADSGVSTDGSNNVTTWNDETGNNSVAQSASATEPLYVTNDVNGMPAVRFNGSQWLFNPNNLSSGINTNLTIITVGSTSNPGSQQYAAWFGGTVTGQGRGLGYASNEQLFDTSGINYLAGTAPAANAFAIQAATVYANNGAVTLYQNGANEGTGPLSGVQGISSGITVGAAGNETSGWQGDIAEVLVYDHQLSADELQQVDLYLANKYNIPVTVPGPVISPAAGSYAGPQTITLSMAALSGATIYYTLDGATPSVSSYAYTTPFTLSASATVKAAIFWSDGTQIGGLSTAQLAINSATPPGAPPAPTGLAVTTSSSDEELDLSWTIGSGAYDTTDVYRSDNGGAYILIATLDPGTTTYADQNVVAGVNYQYEVGTLNSAGETTSGATSQTQAANISPVGISVTTPSTAVPLP
jgi:alpha-tubulin suppressor-like RCC1 family protein